MQKTKSTKLIPVLVLLGITTFITSCATNKDIALSQIDDFITQQKTDKTKKDWKTRLSIPPQVEFSKDKKYSWHLKTTQGDMTINFLPDEAPMHVSSTIYLTNLGYYDDIVFHRVITGFMAQGGDPVGNGSGGPGYKYDGEYSGQSKHDKAGTLSMANAGAGTDGSQFFITFKPTPHLDGRHTVFGYIETGMDVLQKIEKLGSRNGRTSTEVKIINATIVVE